MCGINGIISKKATSTQQLKEALTKMNDLIIHRGPDDYGVSVSNSDNMTVAMGMRRLSIIDLSSGQQPMFSEDKKITIVFNGEIYNFKQLKTQLISDGVTFKTTSDTEVILKLYEQKGSDAFKLLDGMYGLSIHDQNSDKIFIARDYFGEKPMYYSAQDGEFYWASELKSIINMLDYKPQINTKGLNLFFRLTYIPAPYTIYDGIHKLESNSFMTYDLKLNTFEIKTIHKQQKSKLQNITFDDAKVQVKDRVYKSVESRSISDVPLGTFLSGGVDSSVVSYCLSDITDSKIDTFSIGFEKKSYDETDKSQVVAKLINSNHHEFIISENDLKHHIDDILYNFDEPFADSSSLPTYLVSNRTKSHVKVALTGDGGDEIFGGYNKYYIGKLNNRYTNIVPKGIHSVINNWSSKLLNRKDDNRGFKYKLNKLIKAIDYSDGYYWDIISLAFSTEDINTFLSTKYQDTSMFEYFKTVSKISNPKTLNDFRRIDKHISLEGDMLVKVDRTSMLNSLECRAPFLNRELYEFTMSLPEDYLLHKWSKKHILKETFKDVFPSGFLEKSKQGFGVPVGDWLRSNLKKELLSYIEPQLLDSQNIFNAKEIIGLVKNHVSGKQDNTFKVWAFFCFQKWYSKAYLN
ncbi:asparagine synthase (glutamine-hydrolyzing) [Ichthyenterobacterium magnum]|uniref:asparagine synthase (glutamine-hydrolyzing) n=1 Tax=Ichthyenterobacterium magnum TaxID=1230530 RepID=A0A420DM82_9FLAO|nr:asparagine synthase (glutamine-hydrolyzing) [Ichthyenterobacterium magnum]RKE95305.1 asparagine synthase (glutamine-hydrolysing) [Ichthyenterobacterium magnum]